MANRFLHLIKDTLNFWSTNTHRSYFQGLGVDAIPVLWFGDIDADKPIVMTVGSNPSDREFNKANSNAPVTLPRFQSNSVQVKSNSTVPAIADSYNSYFNVNPYTSWFGKNGGNAGLEAALNYLDASFYGNAQLQAVHFDWFPFPTKQKFGEIKHDQWINSVISTRGKDCIDFAIDNLKPEKILAVGMHSLEMFCKYSNIQISSCITNTVDIRGVSKHKYELDYKTPSGTVVRVQGSNLYFPNPHLPKGSTSVDWTGVL